MAESKIQATDRLRKEGLCAEASQFREKQRVQLRAEGMPRATANEESWRLMLENYQPPDMKRWHAYMANIESPPSCVPDDIQPTFDDVWYVFNVLMARCVQWHPKAINDENLWDNDREPIVRARLDFQRNQTRPVSRDSTYAMLKWATTLDPIAFLQLAETTFRMAIEQIPDDAPAAAETKAELFIMLGLFPSVRQIAPEVCRKAREGDGRELPELTLS